ncbi:bifunctional aspartate kinase/homoserine dehydrogenase I [Rhizosphaericola mali]|uniref:Bifunctional aspartate kinase/homoserine dehydrogenase I n=1 Tax=Rhizosphaericola mali TaxID=2545455 RepID=A0A5P2G7P1_9BACT|nr:bifunctional aspartate kinase/homoserine dehydrogenase I [Rhizosphaericola mali]QES87541.1 bifunctional aspartate kinase/homoserine dehydrogenase I [Rhizosphaericola mali]
MQVLKFGGSSVANAENIKKVVQIVTHNNYAKQIVVVSAMKGVTDKLLQLGDKSCQPEKEYEKILQSLTTQHIEAANELLPVATRSGCLSMIMQIFNELEDICESVFRLQELSPATKDRIVGYGELLSSKIISAYLESIKVKNVWMDSRAVIETNNNYSYAAVDFEKTNVKIKDFLKSNPANLYMAPGFIARGNNGHATTLGRGGSDYSAAIYAAAVDAPSLEIWTDVSGMMTADPRWVPSAKPIPMISYKEAMELSHFGAKVIYPPTILPVMQKNIPVWVKNTFAPEDKGTLMNATASHEGNIVSGISSITEVALLSLEGGGMVGIPGFSKTLFEALAFAKVNVILITQGSSEYSICVAVNAVDASRASEAINKAFEFDIVNNKVFPVVEEDNLSIVALVGDKMKSHPNISGKMFGTLGRNGINVRAIAQGSSEKNISAVISNADVKKAVNVLHEAFFESVYKQLNVYVVGTGNVGGRLLEQIHHQLKYLKKNLSVEVRIVGLSNSRNMLIKENGSVSLTKWKEELEAAEAGDLDTFVNAVISKNLRNSIVVDVTANAAVAAVYGRLLSKSIAVVACNKIAASSSYASYAQLKSLSHEFNAPFLFETNVGAGLPVIGTLNDLIRSGDVVNKVQAVLSGTLNFVFNNYDATKPFAEVVRQAQAEGYTEPDPRLDLGGTDVMRKIMILAREAGYILEMDEIKNKSFLPASCFEGSVEDFYKEMEKHEAHFKALYNAAAKENCKLKFVAEFVNGKASVGLQHIPADSDFYHLYGKDNIVLFYTMRYPDQPLVVKGAGAGADVTASGVFADLIKAGI